MSTATIELQDAELLRAIGSALALLEHPRELMEAIGARLESNVQQRFDTKRAPSGAPWPALAPATVSYWYARKYPRGIPGSLLERTRQLRASLAFNTGDDWLEIGTSRAVPGKKQPEWQVGFLHEFGTAKMPPRRLLTADPETGTLGEQDQRDVLDILSRHIGEAFEGL
jgi:phage virion morphogenesis protein